MNNGASQYGLDWWLYKAGFLFFAAATLLAAAYLGYVFGWVSGSSMTPVVATIAPLILGLLAGVGLTTGVVPLPSIAAALEKLPAFAALGERDKSKIKTDLVSVPDYWQLGLVGLALFLFGIGCECGLRVGGNDRDDPFPPLSSAIAGWDDLDIAMRTEVYDLRWRLKDAGMRGNEFSNLAIEVIEPILSDAHLSNDSKIERLKNLADRFSKKAHSPEP